MPQSTPLKDTLKVSHICTKSCLMCVVVMVVNFERYMSILNPPSIMFRFHGPSAPVFTTLMHSTQEMIEKAKQLFKLSRCTNWHSIAIFHVKVLRRVYNFLIVQDQDFTRLSDFFSSRLFVGSVDLVNLCFMFLQIPE